MQSSEDSVRNNCKQLWVDYKLAVVEAYVVPSVKRDWQGPNGIQAAEVSPLHSVLAIEQQVPPPSTQNQS
jgi:hypothetical protein